MWLLRVVFVSMYFVTGTVDVILFPQHVVAGDCCVLWLFQGTLWPVIVMYCGCDFVSTTRYLWLLRVVSVYVYFVTTKCDVLWMWFCFHNTLLPVLRVVIVSVYFVTSNRDVLWMWFCFHNTLLPVLRVVIVSVYFVTSKCNVLWMWFCFHKTLLLMAAMCYDSCGWFSTWCYLWFRCAVVSCWWHTLLGAMCCIFVLKPGVTCECAVLCFRWKE